MVEYTYDSWGKLISTTGSKAGTVGAANPFRYRGYYYDSESGLYYLNSRYYDPETGRFVNADGYASTGQELNGSNMFAYCLNNPIVYSDPIGKFVFGFEVVLNKGISIPNISAPEISVPNTPAVGPIPFVGYYDITAPDSQLINCVRPVITPAAKSKAEKYQPKIPGNRYHYPTKKGAEEAARRAGKGKKTIYHPPQNGRPPHFHPNVDRIVKLTKNMVSKHDH